MAKKIALTVPEPCHENWDNMNRVEQGRYCQSCQKQVIDFTDMSDDKLVAFFRKSPTQVCGRFRNDQLKRELAIPGKRVPWFKYFLQVALPAALFSSKGYTQGAPMRIQVISHEPMKKDADIVVPKVDVSGGRVLVWQVIDPDGNSIPYARIWRDSIKEAVFADSAGYFKLVLDEADPVLLMEVSQIGFTRRTIKIDLKKEDLTPLISLDWDKMDTMVTAGMIAVKVKRSTPMIIPKIMEAIPRSPGHFKLFPNPVISGGSLNIELVDKIREGYYDLLVIGLDGKRVYQKEIWIDSDARVMNIELPVIASGQYIINLKERKTGKEFGEKLVIQ